MLHYYFSDKAHIFWDDVIESVVIRWSYLAHEEDFRIPLNKLVELVAIRKAKKALFDESHSLFIANETQWLSDEWFPRLLNAGIEIIAIVFPEKTVTNIDVGASIENKNPNDLLYREFDNIHSAVSWLSSVPIVCVNES